MKRQIATVNSRRPLHCAMDQPRGPPSIRVVQKPRSAGLEIYATQHICFNAHACARLFPGSPSAPESELKKTKLAGCWRKNLTCVIAGLPRKRLRELFIDGGQGDHSPAVFLELNLQSTDWQRATLQRHSLHTGPIKHQLEFQQLPCSVGLPAAPIHYTPATHGPLA